MGMKPTLSAAMTSILSRLGPKGIRGERGPESLRVRRVPSRDPRRGSARHYTPLLAVEELVDVVVAVWLDGLEPAIVLGQVRARTSPSGVGKTRTTSETLTNFRPFSIPGSAGIVLQGCDGAGAG